jgi:hypothetical protein
MKNTNTTNGGSKVPAGFYFNRNNWEIVTVSGKKGGLLPGDATDYLKVPAVAMLAGAPVLGAAFVVFLPVIGFALLATAAWKKAFRPVGTPKAAHVRSGD